MSDTETTIRPALTPEQWEAKREIAGWVGPMVAFDGGTTGVRVVGPEERHGIAALALYDQPFGFTREDVAMLRDVVDACQGLTYELTLPDLITRIAALLPPE